MRLRPYQSKAIEDTKRLFAGRKRVVLAQPTGAGKTVMGAEIARRAATKGKCVTFVCDQINLVHQTSARFNEWGIEHGVIQADNDRDTDRPVMIASAQSIETRMDRDGWTPPGLVVLDECHIQRDILLKRLKEADSHVLGLTATPCAAGMGEFYEAMTCQPTQWFFDHGWLIRPTFETANPRGADMASYPVEEWTRRFGDLDHPPKTVTYSNTVSDSMILAEAFRDAGITAAAIHGKTSDRQRSATLGRFADGAVRVLCSCDILIKGFDQPDVECLVIAKRVKGLIRALQILGRGMRTAPGKTSCTVLDHTGMYEELGLQIETHWRCGFNELLLNKMRRSATVKAMAGIAVKREALRYVDAKLLPKNYSCETELWLNICKWVSDRVGIEWAPDAREWHQHPQKSPQHRAYWLAVMNYHALTGISKAKIRKVPFFASDSCPDAIKNGLEKRLDDFKRLKDKEKGYDTKHRPQFKSTSQCRASGALLSVPGTRRSLVT